jgi:hypothetical protein
MEFELCLPRTIRFRAALAIGASEYGTEAKKNKKI